MTNNKLYRVTWTIEVAANDAQDAADTALAVQRDRFSDAVVFEVQECIDGDTNNLGAVEVVDLIDDFEGE